MKIKTTIVIKDKAIKKNKEIKNFKNDKIKNFTITRDNSNTKHIRHNSRDIKNIEFESIKIIEYKYSKFNSIDEDNELDDWITIYNKNSFNEHYEVNDYITKNKLWDKFPKIRSLNDHAEHKAIPGILPKFYAQICKKLDIDGAGGSPLDKAIHY